jgi:hypothetical protein
MKQYYVINNQTGYNETFYSLKVTKKAMVENNAKGFITKVRTNGDWIPCGEIQLKGSNKTFIANTAQEIKNY